MAHNRLLRPVELALQLMKGVNVNCAGQDFCKLILSGLKTVETRRTKSLHPYEGRRVGLVRTGCGPAVLVGFATIGAPFQYNRKTWRAGRHRHQVKPGGQFDGGQWGYPLCNVKPCAPKLIKSRGIVAREI